MPGNLILFVCADVNGNKMNLEVQFDKRPTLEQLVQRIEAAYNSELVGYGFRVERLQSYDSLNMRWDDLTDSGPLKDFLQIYAFQPPRTIILNESSGAIPSAVKPADAPAPRTAVEQQCFAVDDARRATREFNARNGVFSTDIPSPFRQRELQAEAEAERALNVNTTFDHVRRWHGVSYHHDQGNPNSTVRQAALAVPGVGPAPPSAMGLSLRSELAASQAQRSINPNASIGVKVGKLSDTNNAVRQKVIAVGPAPTSYGQGTGSIIRDELSKEDYVLNKGHDLHSHTEIARAETRQFAQAEWSPMRRR